MWCRIAWVVRKLHSVAHPVSCAWQRALPTHGFLMCLGTAC